jgi:restriction system protein
MAVPDYQTLMRPVLALHADGQEHAVSAVRDTLAVEFALTSTDLAEQLPSGRARTYVNRVGWAMTYLYRAGLLERPKRSVYRITKRGRAVLDEHPVRVDNEVLNAFEEFRQFRTRGASSTPAGGSPPPSPSLVDQETPEELMSAAHHQIRGALAADLLDRIMERDPAFFERLVIDVLEAMGYGGYEGAAQRLGGTGDQGFDGVIDEDRLGLDRIYVQAKRWANPVGRPALQAFVGALAGRGASKGVFITTSAFTAEARSYVGAVQARVVLIDGPELDQLMVRHDVGVTLAQSFDVKKVDLDYFTPDDEGIDGPAPRA